MKILHTSDWHLGHKLYGRDRTAEQLTMLHTIGDIVSKEQPDLLLISGDVFHTGQPTAQVQRMFADALLEYSESAPDMRTVVITGNHDSASKMGIFERPWKKANVFIVSCLDPEFLEKQIVELPGKGFVIAVPYTYSRNMPDSIFSDLCGIVKERNDQRLPVVIGAHTTVFGCVYTGHDNASDRSIGGIDAVDIDDFGSDFDYLALGHIHRPQTLGDGQRVRYSGTPLPVSFDERFTHTVSVVEIKHHGDTPVVREIEIENPVPLVTLPDQGYAEWDDVLGLLMDFPDGQEAYIRLCVLTDGFLPVDAREQVDAVTTGKNCSVVTFNCMMRDAEGDECAEKEMTADELQKINPVEIARGLLPEGEFDEELEKMFAEVYRLVKEEEREED